MHDFLVEKHMEDVDISGRIILRWISGHRMGCYELALSASG
jgi:hypothetical protein